MRGLTVEMSPDFITQRYSVEHCRWLKRSQNNPIWTQCLAEAKMSIKSRTEKFL